MEEIKDRKRLKLLLAEAILTERERKILDYRFGLTDNTPHTLEETGKLFRLTRERIRQIESKALGKIRQETSEKQ